MWRLFIPYDVILTLEDRVLSWRSDGSSEVTSLTLDPVLVRMETNRKAYSFSLHIRESFPRPGPTRVETFSCSHQSIFLDFEAALLQVLGMMSFANVSSFVKLPHPGVVSAAARAEVLPALLPHIREMDPSKVLLDQLELGDGAFGKVLQAYDASQGGLSVAVKSVRPKLDAKEKRLFQDEILLHTRLSHPNVVKYLYALVWGSSFYLVLNYCDGGTLLDLIRHCTLTEQQAAYFLHEILAGIEYIHASHLVHRDIKPENILLTASGHVQIADFGLATDVSNNRVLTSHAGTLGYMSPEMLRHEAYGQPADLFSLGTVMYRMVHGQSLFSQGSALFRLFHTAFDRTIAPFPLKPSKTAPPLSDDCLNVLADLLHPRAHMRSPAAALLQHAFFKDASEPPGLQNVMDLAISTRALEAMGF